MHKTSPEFEESMHRYQKAAKLFQGKVSLDWEIPLGIRSNRTLVKGRWGQGREINGGKKVVKR